LVINCDYTAIKGNAIYTTIDSRRQHVQIAEIEKYRSIAIKNVLDELYRKLNFRLKLKNGQSKALNNIDGNDVFAVYESLANTTATFLYQQ
jgi:hypothetical protein